MRFPLGEQAQVLSGLRLDMSRAARPCVPRGSLLVGGGDRGMDNPDSLTAILALLRVKPESPRVLGGPAGAHTPHPPPVVTGNWPGSVHPTSVGMFHSTGGGLFPSSWVVRGGWGHCSTARCEPLEQQLLLRKVILPPHQWSCWALSSCSQGQLLPCSFHPPGGETSAPDTPLSVGLEGR